MGWIDGRHARCSKGAAALPRLLLMQWYHSITVACVRGISKRTFTHACMDFQRTL